MKTFVFFLCLGVFSLFSEAAPDLEDIFGKCVTDSSCKQTEYCDKDFPNPFGECKIGRENGALCLTDAKCASKRCSFFICKERVARRDGPCKVDQDCPNDQFCQELRNTDDLKQCSNRRCNGMCTKNSECKSNKCHLLVCTGIVDGNC